MTGWVADDGTPCIRMNVANQEWPAFIDTGFNNDLELPRSVFSEVVVDYIGLGKVQLAGGRTVEEEFYLVHLTFDDAVVTCEATFVDLESILIGTRLLRQYRLIVDFPARTVDLQRTG